MRDSAPMRDNSLLEIDLAAVTHNLGVIRGLVGPDVAVCPVVKADAYGLGAPRIARTLAAAGADLLAVYNAEQATALLREAVAAPILVLMPVHEIRRTDPLYRALVCGRLHLAVHDLEHAASLARLSERFGCTIPLHIELDTGLRRGGCDLESAPALLAAVHAHPRLALAGVYTHFASSDVDEEATQAQDAMLEAFLEEHRAMIPASAVIHAASTFATIRSRAYHRSMVRIGVSWAGYGSELVQGAILDEAHALRPCVRWTSHVVHAKSVPAGAQVGYRGRWSAPCDSVIGLVPVGYADGYPFALGDGGAGAGRGMVRVQPQDDARWHDAPVVGAVNMDQLTVDLTAVPGARAGATVELIGRDPGACTHLPRLAEAARTIPYEILCRLSPRLPRIHLTQAVHATTDGAAVASGLPAIEIVSAQAGVSGQTAAAG